MLLCRGVNFYLFVVISCIVVIISSFRDRRILKEEERLEEIKDSQDDGTI